MDLPLEQDDVSIHVIIVVLEASYQGATHNLLERLNDGFVKSNPSSRGRVKKANGRVWVSSEEITQKGRIMMPTC
jgi:hypothetical protein